MYMLWFNFILGSNFISLCLKLTIIHYITQKQKNIKFEPRTKDKIEPQHIKRTIRLKSSVTVFLIPSFRRSTVSSGNVRKIKKILYIPERCRRSVNDYIEAFSNCVSYSKLSPICESVELKREIR